MRLFSAAFKGLIYSMADLPMKSFIKKLILSALVLMTAAGFSGCAAMLYGDGLLVLPGLPNEYVDLQQQIDKVLSTGALSAAADSGENRQSIQLVDLDGDGGNETVAFFRQTDGSFLIKAYKKEDESYVEIGSAEAVGLSLHSIYYPTISATGQKCIAVCWGIDDSNNYGMEIYYFDGGGMESLLNVRYSGVMVGDLYGDGLDELCFVSKDRSGSGLVFSVYSVKGGEYALDWETPLCEEAAEIASMEIGQYDEGRRGAFIDSVTEEGFYVTDLIAGNKGGVPVSMTSDEEGSGKGTLREIPVFCHDIDGDGLTEVPSAVKTAGLRYPDEKNMIKWTEYGFTEKVKETTYHAPSDGWYLKWPENWDDTVRAAATRYSRMTRTVFYRSDSADTDEEPVAPEEGNTLLTVYIFSGDNRQNYPGMYHATEIGRRDGQIYAYALGGGSHSRYDLDEEKAAESVMLIETDWIGGGY